MDIVPPPVVVSQPRSHLAQVIALIVAIIIAGLIGAYITVVLKVPLLGHLGKEAAARLLPAELDGVVFVQDAENRTTLVHADGGRFVGTVLGSNLVSATDGAQIRHTPTGTFQVVLDDVVIIDDALPRMGITRAPQGGTVAFAIATEPDRFISPAAAPALTLDRKNWKVLVYTPARGITLDLGPGVSPFFIDDTHVAWMAPAGLAVVDLSTGSSTVVLPDTESRVPALQLVSPDRSVMGLYAPASKEVSLYRVTATGAELIATLTPPAPIRSLALSNDALYAVRSDTISTEILKQSFTAPSAVSVGRLPDTMQIHRILFGSL